MSGLRTGRGNARGHWKSARFPSSGNADPPRFPSDWRVGCPEQARPLVELRDDLDTLLVGSGIPLSGAEVTVLNEHGAPVGDGVLGEIAVRGPMIAGGYLDGTSFPISRFERGRLFTGDGGFLLGGELYVLGRLFESLKVNGRTVFVDELEGVLDSSPLRSLGPAAVVATQKPNSVGIAVVVEAQQKGSWMSDVAALLRPLVGPSVEIDVYAAKAGAIPRTTSGKPIRRELWKAIASDRLAD